MLLVLLVWFLDIPKSEEAPYQVIEYFSGVGRIASIAKHTGLKSAAVDIDYGEEYANKRGKRTRSPMDINSNAGLVSPGISSILLVLEGQERLKENHWLIHSPLADWKLFFYFNLSWPMETWYLWWCWWPQFISFYTKRLWDLKENITIVFVSRK